MFYKIIKCTQGISANKTSEVAYRSLFSFLFEIIANIWARSIGCARDADVGPQTENLDRHAL